MKPTFAKPDLSKAKTVVVGIYEGGSLTAAAKEVDTKAGGLISKAAKSGGFSGKKGQFSVVVPARGWDMIVLAGLGKGKDLIDLDMQNLGGAIVKTLNAKRVATASVAVEKWKECKLSEADIAANIAYGATLGAYRFDKYRTKEEDDKKPTLKELSLQTDDAAKAKTAYDRFEKIAEGVLFTRDLVSEPANVIHPESLAGECKKLTKLGVKVKILGESEMKKLGMGALLGVGQGSEFESQLVVMEWNGTKAAKGDKPLAFVGKGVCFDTGGISIKPSNNMEEMKWDMGGAGAVIGLMHALAARKAKANVVGVVGLVENMPSGTAQRPGDVVTSMSGQTIEVINTDAEGRLVLADALWYTQDRFKPKFIVDLATLTGAIITALAGVRAGLFSNDDQLAERLFKAGEAVAEPVWRFPLGDEYDKMINCDIADVRNVGDGSGAGSITAAQFLQRFVNDTPWAHLDIAGVAWSKKDKDITPKGGTGYGVRLLERLVAEYYEK
ncbi:MAG: leucyl aminopeptidase [Alphaproteobacteria bacterium]|nr:leucyl aminopeptidase [Alphaproteobacteria bacterium]